MFKPESYCKYVYMDVAIFPTKHTGFDQHLTDI